MSPAAPFDMFRIETMTHLTRRGLIGAAAGALALSGAGRALAQGAAPAGHPSLAPVSVRDVGLWVRDAGQVAEWYQQVVGLSRLAESAETITLGVRGAALLHLHEDSALRLTPPNEAGLYHTAFLLPRRSDLAKWVTHASQRRFPVDGVADHLVSEAIYLTDPEGNGVEIYADRPAETWIWRGGQVEMATDPIDFNALLATVRPGEPPWVGAPRGTTVGHVHLRVGDAARGGAWWRGEMGFDSVRARGGAEFLSTGGYHHHIAVNEWQSAGAGPRLPGLTGLAYVTLQSRAGREPAVLADPWGTEIRLTA